MRHLIELDDNIIAVFNYDESFVFAREIQERYKELSWKENLSLEETKEFEGLSKMSVHCRMVINNVSFLTVPNEAGFTKPSPNYMTGKQLNDFLNGFDNLKKSVTAKVKFLSETILDA